MIPFETRYTKEVVCPHCGGEYSDSWEIQFPEYNPADIEMECDSCEEKFRCIKEIEITYTTSKVNK